MLTKKTEQSTYLSNKEHMFDSSKLLKALVIPRPIALVTSLGPNGVVNAAPFSYFNIVSANPGIISLSITKRGENKKDTAKNILDRREFTVNICSSNFADIMELTSQHFPPDVSEIEMAKLELLPSICIKTPRIAGVLAHLECSLNQIVTLENGSVELILGDVLNIHVEQKIIDEKGKIKQPEFNPIARGIGNTYWP